MPGHHGPDTPGRICRTPDNMILKIGDIPFRPALHAGSCAAASRRGPPCHTRDLDFPVFDADNHLYETADAFTKYLPDGYKGAIDYVEVAGRTKIVVRGPDQRVHPQPDLRRGGRARRPGGLLPATAIPRARPAGRSSASRCGAIPAFREPGAPARADGRAGHRPGADVPHAGQPARGADARRPRARPTPSSTPSTSGCTRRGRSTTRAGSSPRRSSRCPSWSGRSRSSSGCWSAAPSVVLIRPGPGPGLPRLPVVRPPGVRPVLAEGGGARHPGRHALLGQRLRRDTPTTGWAATARCCPSSPRPSGCCRPWRPADRGHRGRPRLPRGLSRFPDLKVASIENGSSWVPPLLKHLGGHLQEDAAGVPRGPGRGVQAQHLHQPVLGGRTSGTWSTLIGADHVLFGSDYPHPEGLADPVSYVDELAGPADEDVGPRSWAATWPA